MLGNVGTMRSAKTFYVQNEPQVVVSQRMKNRRGKNHRVPLKMSNQSQSSPNTMTVNPLKDIAGGTGVCKKCVETRIADLRSVDGCNKYQPLLGWLPCHEFCHSRARGNPGVMYGCRFSWPCIPMNCRGGSRCIYS